MSLPKSVVPVPSTAAPFKVRFVIEMASVDILVPTSNRLESVIMTLSSLASQEHNDFHLIIADQSDEPIIENQVIASLLRIVKARQASFEYHHRLPLHGIAEQRHFLLQKSSAPFVLYVDDDVYLEPWVLGKLMEVIRSERCGFVGAFGSGLSYLDDVRPNQQAIEYWQGPVEPEVVEPGSRAWDRARLHSAANMFHVSQRIPAGEVRLYKVAWVGACCLYDREKLLAVGGFSFWYRLPRYHSGEEVLVQNLLMRLFGGCAIIPSGTYFSQVETTVLNEEGTVDGHALDLLPEMIARYAPNTASQSKSYGD